MTTDDAILANLATIKARREKAEAVKESLEREILNGIKPQKDTASLFGYPIISCSIVTREQLEDSTIGMDDIVFDAMERIARAWGIVYDGSDLQSEREENQRAKDAFFRGRP